MMVSTSVMKVMMMKKKSWRTAAMAVVVTAMAAGVAAAQSRPLVTEDPEVVGPGQMLVEAGIDRRQGVTYPASGLQGNLFRLGTFGLSIGVSSIAEIQLDGGLRDSLTIKNRLDGAPLAGMLTIPADATSTSDVMDGVIGAKVRFLSETARRPAMALKFSTKLPNAGNEKGLGLDTTDFAFQFLGAKTVQSIRVVGNFGFAILGDPTRGDRQNDVILYGVSFARAIRQGVEFVTEMNGRANTRAGTAPVGTDSQAMMRVGARITRGTVRLDGALLIGVTERDPSWGLSAGLTWVFKAFSLPAS
jgi:hypothetical protein